MERYLSDSGIEIQILFGNLLKSISTLSFFTYLSIRFYQAFTIPTQKRKQVYIIDTENNTYL